MTPELGFYILVTKHFRHVTIVNYDSHLIAVIRYGACKKQSILNESNKYEYIKIPCLPN
jgi:hypothetical protein